MSFSTCFLLLEKVKIHEERDLKSKGGVIVLEFDFWLETALQIGHYEPTLCLCP